MDICLLVSGGLGFQILADVYAQDLYNIVAVFTDKNSEVIISFCDECSLPCFAGNPRKGAASEFIQTISCEILLSVNYLFIIEKDLIQLPKKIAINIHGSLLPKYRGRTPHVWAIINGEKETGITVHVIDEEVDNGGIIKQVSIPIREDDTGADILRRFKTLYPVLVKEVLEEISNNKYTVIPQDITKGTYFGKRTPNDGKINWNWSKERIRNWIRAQAKPYPGAFTFCKDKKVVIHKAILTEMGYRYDTPNGTILEAFSDQLIVKTPNGTLQISELESDQQIEFRKGDILS